MATSTSIAWTCNGKENKRITSALGYDGGAWFSPDGKKIIWRATRPTTPEAVRNTKNCWRENGSAYEYGSIHSECRWQQCEAGDQPGPGQLGAGVHARWRGSFCSNHEYKRGFPFNMYMMNADGTKMAKVSRDKGFDAFPMFSPDGKKIVFCSNRNNGGTRDTNIFIADWVE